tara:strand:+ start:4532 stop:5017 length:486 start_codon:yes stop_codon:yes gene_type:complete
MLAANPVSATPVMPYHDAPRELDSPPFVDSDSRELSLADFRGKVVLLNVWATWCVPCREEMPTLDSLQARLGGEDFHVLPLSVDQAGLEPVRRFYEEIGIRHLGMYLTKDLRAMIALEVIGLPTTLIIDREGREIARRVGPAKWDSPEFVTQFETVIERRP